MMFGLEDELYQKIRDLETRLEASTWREIAVHGLPKVDAPCIVYAESADPDKPMIYQAWYDPSFGWSLLPRVWIDAITHWMPMPKPPNKPSPLRSKEMSDSG